MKWHKINWELIKKDYTHDLKDQERWPHTSYLNSSGYRINRHYKFFNSHFQVNEVFRRYFHESPIDEKFNLELFMKDLIAVLPALKVTFNTMYGDAQRQRGFERTCRKRGRSSKGYPNHHPFVSKNGYDYADFFDELCYISDRWCCQHRIVFLFGLINKYQKGELNEQV